MRKQREKTRTWGELSIEDYLRATGAPELGDLSKADEGGGNGSDGRSSSPPGPPVPTKRLGRTAKGIGIALVLIVVFAAGSVWTWSGKWATNLTLEQALQVVTNPSYSEIEAQNALRRIREEVRDGVRALARIAELDTPSGMHARAHLERTASEAQELFSQLRIR